MVGVADHRIFGVGPGGDLAGVVAVEMIIAVERIEVVALNPDRLHSPILVQNVMRSLGVIPAPLRRGIGSIGHQWMVTSAEVANWLQDTSRITMPEGVAVIAAHPLDEPIEFSGADRLIKFLSTRNPKAPLAGKCRPGIDQKSIVGLDPLL